MKKLLLTIAFGIGIGNSAFAAAAADLSPTSEAARLSNCSESESWLKSGVVCRSLTGQLTAFDLQNIKSVLGINTSNSIARALLVLAHPSIPKERMEADINRSFCSRAFDPQEVDPSGFLPYGNAADYYETLNNISRVIGELGDSASDQTTKEQLLRAISTVSTLMDNSFGAQNSSDDSPEKKELQN